VVDRDDEGRITMMAVRKKLFLELNDNNHQMTQHSSIQSLQKALWDFLASKYPSDDDKNIIKFTTI
jgi:hypothetical protein